MFKELLKIKKEIEEIEIDINDSAENRYELINMLNDIKSLISDKQAKLENDFFKIEKVEDDLVIIFAIFYRHPTEQKDRLEKILKDFRGTIVLDYLLCNGTGNRFFEAEKNDDKFPRKEFKEISDELLNRIVEKQYLKTFYLKNMKLFENNHILSSSTKMEILEELVKN